MLHRIGFLQTYCVAARVSKFLGVLTNPLYITIATTVEGLVEGRSHCNFLECGKIAPVAAASITAKHQNRSTSPSFEGYKGPASRTLQNKPLALQTTLHYPAFFVLHD